jgi:hypothetical protein
MRLVVEIFAPAAANLIRRESQGAPSGDFPSFLPFSWKASVDFQFLLDVDAQNMNRKEFTDPSTGRRMRTIGGYAAFVPSPHAR